MTSAINSAGGVAVGVAIFLALILMWQRFDDEVTTRKFWMVAPALAVLAVVGVGMREYTP